MAVSVCNEYLDGHELSVVLAPGNCVKPVHIKWPGKDPFMSPTLPDGRSLYSIGLIVGCGKCPACQAGKRREWFTRIMMEYKTCKTCYFITLTYNDAHLPKNGVEVRECQNFMKRLRKSCPSALRYFFCSEYGSKSHRPHYHMILFDFPSTDANVVAQSVLEAWSPRGDEKGFVYVAGFGEAAAMYVTKYVLKDKNIMKEYLPDELLDEYDPEVTYVPENDGKNPTFQLSSRKPALGFHFFEDADLVDHLHEVLEPFIRIDGKKYIMPRYSKLQIFDAWERRQMYSDYLWDKVELLAKQVERYKTAEEVHKLVRDRAIDRNRTIIRNRNKQKSKEKV